MKYRMSIPKPCGEDWNSMEVVELGRYCSVCEKVVFDYSEASEQDLIELIKRGDKICGRFPKRYVDMDLIENEKRRSIGMRGLVATAVNLVALTTMVSCNGDKEENGNLAREAAQETLTKVKYTEPYVLKGKVIADDVFMPRSVSIAGILSYGDVDESGAFELYVPKSIKRNKDYLLIEGHYANDVRIEISDINKFYEIELKMADVQVVRDDVMGEPGYSVDAKVE